MSRAEYRQKHNNNKYCGECWWWWWRIRTFRCNFILLGASGQAVDQRRIRFVNVCHSRFMEKCSRRFYSPTFLSSSPSRVLIPLTNTYLRWWEYSPVTCPCPVQPGVGHFDPSVKWQTKSGRLISFVVEPFTLNWDIGLRLKREPFYHTTNCNKFLRYRPGNRPNPVLNWSVN